MQFLEFSFDEGYLKRENSWIWRINSYSEQLSPEQRLKRARRVLFKVNNVFLVFCLILKKSLKIMSQIISGLLTVTTQLTDTRVNNASGFFHSC